MSRDIKRDIMRLATCLPPEDILVLTLYIGSFQDAIDRKDALLREYSKYVESVIYGGCPVCGSEWMNRHYEITDEEWHEDRCVYKKAKQELKEAK